jgi:hypothetical protein
MMNRALKQQATELGPNMWQRQQGIAKCDKKFHIFVFHHRHRNIWDSSIVGCITFLTKTFRWY